MYSVNVYPLLAASSLYNLSQKLTTFSNLFTNQVTRSSSIMKGHTSPKKLLYSWSLSADSKYVKIINIHPRV